jgi:hypothetical protein
MVCFNAQMMCRGFSFAKLAVELAVDDLGANALVCENFE